MSSHDSPHADADLIYRLRSLPVAGAVLHVGAHPDDEDSGTIAYLSRGMGVRTVYWSATRGEGGQNRLGPEKGEALGIVRTWESLQARQVDGGEVLYGPFVDFGFSKSGDEALSKWGREDMIREIARAIRIVQPQVVISRWSGGPEDGHGHHQALGLVAEEAFDAAADGDAFPDLAERDLPRWQAQKLYHSMQGDWQPGEDVALGGIVPEYEREGVLRINAGGFDPVSGRTFQELAAIGRNRHRTQAMAELPERGDYFYYYGLDRSLVAVDVQERDFFDGLDRTLTGLAVYPGGPDGLEPALAHARSCAERAVRVFHPGDPAEAGDAVLEGLQALHEAWRLAVSERSDLAALEAALVRKLRAFEEAAATCFGIRADCLVAPRRVVPGENVRVTARVWRLGPRRVDDVQVGLRLRERWTAQPAGDAPSPDAAGSEPTVSAAFDVRVPETAELSSPYWLREPRDPYRYRWPRGAPGGLPLDEPLVTAVVDVALGDRRITLEVPGTSRETFVGGYRELPLAVLPPIALQPREQRVILPVEERDQQVELQVGVRATQDGGAQGELGLEFPEGWQARPPGAELQLTRGGESRSFPFQVTVPAAAPPGAYTVGFGVTSEGAARGADPQDARALPVRPSELTGRADGTPLAAATEHRHGVVLQPVWQGAPGVPKPADETNCVSEAFVMAPAAVSVHLVNADFVRTLRYAYVPGVEEEILPSLERFGLDLTVLSDEDIAYADLSSYDAIVVGPNAYLVRDGVRRGAGRLLEYAEHGGTLIVQYQGYGYQSGAFAPYPFRYRQPHGRVTYPDASVTVLEPEHPILHLPNAISPADFDGWVHDRGMYFFGEWDARYVPLLECHDPGEEPQRGGLLVAGYGQGAYVYAAYSFFRQIPAAVPGAVRVFANLLGLAEARIRERMARARTVELFASMSDDELHDVVRLMSERWFDDGTFLARQGEPGSELFLVLEGEVEILKEAGGSWKSYVARGGEAVGELAVLTDMPRSASLRAKGDVKVLSMRGEHFRRLLREHWDMAEGVMQMLATRLATREQVETRSA
jgi:LmbE family N-acetylglucosaminyl deacetylase